MANLSGRVAIITGASKGIGAAIAEKLAGDGAAVAVNFSNSAREAETVVANIQKRGGRAFAVRADVSKLADVKKLFETTVREYGRVHVLVNNAAVYSPAPFEKVDEQLFDRHFSLNVKGSSFRFRRQSMCLEMPGDRSSTLARSPRFLQNPTWSFIRRPKQPSTPSPKVLQLSSVLRRSSSTLSCLALPIPRVSEPCLVPAIFVPLSFPRPLSAGSDNRGISRTLSHFWLDMKPRGLPAS